MYHRFQFTESEHFLVLNLEVNTAVSLRQALHHQCLAVGHRDVVSASEVEQLIAPLACVILWRDVLCVSGKVYIL